MSTMYSSASNAFSTPSTGSSATTVAASNRTSPKLTPPTRYTSRKGSASSSGSSPSVDDDLDKWGYMYSLRVAALHERLCAPSPMQMTSPPPPSNPRLSHNPPNPRLSTTSTMSRFTVATMRSPEIPSPEDGTVPTIKRKKSALSIRLGKDDLKLPKEFVVEFWDRLSQEPGDSGWMQAVRGFLVLVQKRGTKTAAGANMRDIHTLLDTFTTCLPPPGPNCESVKEHQAHLLATLYHALPNADYFVNSKTDKGDLLFRLRAEIQTISQSSPTQSSPKAAEFSPVLMANAMAAKAANGGGANGPSSIGLGRVAPPSASEPRIDSVRRKPSPAWTGDGNLSATGTAASAFGPTVEAVCLVWNVSHETVERDLADTKRYGALEKLYLNDIKTNLTAVARANDPSMRAKQAALSNSLASLLASYPELTRPSSPTSFAQASETDSAATFFTPPRKGAVFVRLNQRAAEGGHTRAASILLERCQQLWDVESRVEKERQVSALVRRWDESLGTPNEVAYGHRLADAVADFAALLSPSEPIPQVLEDLRERLVARLSSAARSIFPTTSLPPPAPPPSIMHIMNAAPSMLINSPVVVKALDDVGDEIRGAAVGEYVMAASDMMGGVHSYQVGVTTGSSGKDAVVEGFEKVASWIESEVSNVIKVWGTGLGPTLNPAAIVIQKQLPLFLAEVQVLETANGAGADVFTLYETTARLLALWERLCPGVDHGFDIDTFFEPHVVAWLRETEVNDTHQWVARTVGMDSWVPEGGVGRHSQSVTDLFEFIRNSTQVVRDLPLGEYKRAVYLSDLSKTASIAVTQYAASLQMLFENDIAPPKPAAQAQQISMPSLSMGGKAGAWLAKGRHAVAKVEQRIVEKKVEGFVVPAAACVKMTDLNAAQEYLEELGYQMEAEETERIIRQKGPGGANDRAARHVFAVTVLRGQNLLTGSAKPADAFVTVVDKESSERLFKSRTVLETEDPKWEQTFEVSVGMTKTLELMAYDRQLVGKHGLIGSRTFHLDPQLFASLPIRDVVLPLSPRGVVHIRIATVGGERNDVTYHLTKASRVLDRAVVDMTRDLVERMVEFIRSYLSPTTLSNLTKPLRDKKKGRVALTEVEIDNSLAPVFDFLDENFAVFNQTFTVEMRKAVMLDIWRRVVDSMISLLIPPLSDKPAPGNLLTPPEVDVVFKWLQQLKGFFNAEDGGIEHGVPMVELQAGGYKDIIMIGQYIDLPTAALKDRVSSAVRAASSVVSVGSGPRSPAAARSPASPSTRFATLQTSTRSRVDEDNERMAEALLRIMRMRPDSQEFLQFQLASLIRGKVDRQGSVL